MKRFFIIAFFSLFACMPPLMAQEPQPAGDEATLSLDQTDLLPLRELVDVQDLADSAAVFRDLYPSSLTDEFHGMAERNTPFYTLCAGIGIVWLALLVLIGTALLVWCLIVTVRYVVYYINDRGSRRPEGK